MAKGKKLDAANAAAEVMAANAVAITECLLIPAEHAKAAAASGSTRQTAGASEVKERGGKSAYGSRFGAVFGAGVVGGVWHLTTLPGCACRPAVKP